MLVNSPVRAMIAIRDKDRAKKFYTESLGLKINREEGDIVALDAGNGTGLILYVSQFAGTAKSTVANFEVPDLEGSMSSVRERGVTFEEYDLPGLKTENGIAQLGPTRGAWFKDPDRNILSMVQLA